MKKFLITFIIVLVLLASALLVYNYFFKEEISPDDLAGQQLIQEELTQTISSEKLKTISSEPILSPIVEGNKVKYYSVNNGYVYQSNFDGSNLIRISSNVLTDLIESLWSPNKDKVIGLFSSGSQTKKYLYDFNNQRAILLNKNIREVVWAPDKEKIAYQYYDPLTEENSINIADPDGSNWQTILKTRMKDLVIEWPSPEMISLRIKPSGLAQSVAYSLDVASGALKRIFNDTFGLTLLWSPQGDKVLYSETNNQGKNLKLKLADKNGQLIGEFKFATLPEKCVWSQDNRSFFCAVPRVIADKAIIPDDYYKDLLNINDDFFKVNLETGQAILLTSSGFDNFNVSSLLLSPQEDYLLFVNKKDGLLYSLEL